MENAKERIIEEFNFSITTQNAYEIAIQSHIYQCFQLCADRGMRLEWGIDKTVHEYDGVTRFEGWFNIIHQASGCDIRKFTGFKCGVVTYLLRLRDIDEDFIFRGCVAMQVLSIMGLSS